VYTFGRQLGSGAFSVVKEGVHKKDASKVAIKVIQKTTVAGEDIKLLRREITNLKTLDHPNILKLYEVYEDKQQFYLVMELVQGKELFDKIVERGQYSERDASHITRQFVSAIEYLHSKGIAHRDLKPENILSVGSGDKEAIKVADFGLSKNFGDEKMMTSCGSPGYVAPEVLECETYDKAVDMWSIGVILYILLVGYPPFYADSDPALFKKIMACDYSFGEGWDVVSDSAKDLIKHLLGQGSQAPLHRRPVPQPPLAQAGPGPLREAAPDEQAERLCHQAGAAQVGGSEPRAFFVRRLLCGGGGAVVARRRARLQPPYRAAAARTNARRK